MQFKSTVNVQSIELLECWLKHATSWNRDKIWSKIFDAEDKAPKPLLPVVLSLFSDFVFVELRVDTQRRQKRRRLIKHGRVAVLSLVRDHLHALGGVPIHAHAHAAIVVGIQRSIRRRRACAAPP